MQLQVNNYLTPQIFQIMISIKLPSISNSLLTKIYIFILALSIYSLWPLYDYSDSMPIRLIKYVDYQKRELCRPCIKMVHATF